MSGGLRRGWVAGVATGQTSGDASAALGGGLRERKKLATRNALSEAAMRLALERGVGNVSAEAIAESVGVSTRTFHNYFANKEEAILAAFWSKMNGLIDELRARPVDEPIWDSLEHVLTRYLLGATTDLREAAIRSNLIEANPALLLPNRALFDQLAQAFSTVIAERTGTDPTRDIYPNVIIAAAHAALMCAMRMWNRGATGRDRAALIAEAFRLVRAGVPEPPRQVPPAPTEDASG